MADSIHKIGSASELLDDLRTTLAKTSADRRDTVARFANESVRVTLHTKDAEPNYARALRPRSGSDPDSEPVLSIHVIDGQSCGIARPRLAWQVADFGLRRVVPGWSDTRHTTFYLRAQQGVAVADWQARQAVVWVPRIAKLPQFEVAAPFRWLFDVLAERLGMLAVHGAALGRLGQGVIVAGEGGSGKSTLALGAAFAGLSYLGDDYCLVVPGSDPVVHALFRTGKWRRGAMLEPFPTEGVAVQGPKAPDDKFLIQVSDMPDVDMPQQADIKGIVLPSFDNASTSARTSKASAADAFSRLAPSTLLQTEASQRYVIATLAKLTRQVPAHHLFMPPDVRASVEGLSSLIEGLATEEGSER